MYRYFLLAVAAFICSTQAFAQYNFSTIVKDTAANALTGVSVSVRGKSINAVSDSTGAVNLKNIPAGNQTILFSHVGFETLEMKLHFPLADDNPQTLLLINEEEDLEEVIVASTRTSRTIRNTPTRVETIDLEEIDEKANMRPNNVSMLLHESTGMQVQQTSATSGNASIRLQGLDGKYTQLLKDGYPSFGNFASGLSILEIPPLDLKQVEIIKGPASTLYGAGAVAGVINFISKTPKEKAEHSFIINQSNVGQTNIGGFSSKKLRKVGYTILGLVNFQKRYDVDKDDFTELPQSNDFTIHPKLFFYPNEQLTIAAGNSFTKGERTGGDVQVIKNGVTPVHTYFEKNETLRNTTTLDISRKINERQQVVFKSAFSYFNRKINTPGYAFAGTNQNSYTEISVVKNSSKQTLLVGGNFIYDGFNETGISSVGKRDFDTKTGGLYVQHTLDISEKIKLESGLRTDAVHYGNFLYDNMEVFVLPRISALFVFSSKWSSRIGGGLGYKNPTVFTEQTETIQYREVQPLSDVKSERSSGGTADINFRTALGSNFAFSVNQLFFYTNIRSSSVLQQTGTGAYFFSNTTRPVNSAGFETNAKLIFKEDLKLFAGYTFIRAKANYLPGKNFLPLQPKSKLNLALIYEKEKKFKLGLEGYFTGRQYLSDNSLTPSYSEFGFMAEKIFPSFSIYINAENFTDTRQSRYKRVVSGPHDAPVFDEIWTHTEGRTFNGGVKVRL